MNKEMKMTTQLMAAKSGEITGQMRQVAEDEHISPEELLRLVADGSVVIPYNNRRNFRAIGIGRKMSTKTNANLGTSADESGIEYELEKLAAAIEAGADTVMDLSTGGDIPAIRAEIISRSTVPVGTAPLCQAVCGLSSNRRHPTHLIAPAPF